MKELQSINVITLMKSIWKQIETSTSAPAWWILEKITEKTQLQLIKAHTITLTEAQQIELAKILDLIINQQMPLQYALGKINFGELTLYIEQPIHIPRPETEEWCLNLAHQIHASGTDNIRILDLCTGSGCIALLLAHALPQATVIGIDINPVAIALAQKNAIANNLSNVSFQFSNLFETFNTTHEKFDIIVSNPPYVTETEWQTMAPHITQWEDKKAFVAPNEGLAIISSIIMNAHNFIHENYALQTADIAQLILEIGHMQAEPAAEYMRLHGYNQVCVNNDFAGKSRTVSGRVVNVAHSTTKE